MYVTKRVYNAMKTHDESFLKEQFAKGRQLYLHGAVCGMGELKAADESTTIYGGVTEDDGGTAIASCNLLSAPGKLKLRAPQCSCTAAFAKGEICKHIAALVYAKAGGKLSNLYSKDDPAPGETVEKPDFVPKTMEILLGTNLKNEEQVFWHPNDTEENFHINTGIIGTMGTGKTQFTKSLIAQLVREQDNNYDGKPLGLLIFDYKGDYNETKPDFVREVKPSILRPYQLPFNPFAIYRTAHYKPLLPTHTANTFKETISKIYKLGAKQQNALFSCIMRAYEENGILASNSATWDRKPPTFSSVYRIYCEDETIKKNDSLAAAMEKLHEFCVFEERAEKTRPLFDLLKRPVVVDLSGYDSDIQNLVVAITLELFYSQMHREGGSCHSEQLRQLTRIILVDEADAFMGEEFPVLKRIMKEGREFGVGMILSTQYLENFTKGEEDYSKFLLNWVVHNVSDLKPADVEKVFCLKQKSSEITKVYNEIKQLDKHCSLVKIGNREITKIRDRAFFELTCERKQ